MKIRNADGDMLPLGSAIEVRDAAGPVTITRYNTQEEFDLDKSELRQRLRGKFKSYEYQSVILPIIIIPRIR